nr:hypothetical protein [Tanacetum cinerariifolium]
MSSASSTVTYNSVYNDSEPGRPVAPPSPDYIPGPEEPQKPPAPQDEDEHEPMFIQPHDPDYVLEPMYPDYIPLEDKHVLSAKEQPLHPIDSPTAESPGYVAELDPEEDPEEYEDDETEDGLVDYPMDEGDDGDDDDGDSSGDVADDEDKDEDDEEEKEAEVERLLAMPTLPPSPLTSLSPPSVGERLARDEGYDGDDDDGDSSGDVADDEDKDEDDEEEKEAKVERLLAMPILPPSPLTSLSPPSVGERLARMASTQALINAVTAALPSPPLPPPLYIPPPVDRRDDISETEMPPRKRLYVEARRRGIGEVGYGIKDTWVDPVEAVPDIAPMILGEVNTRVTELAELNEHDTQDLYALLEDAQDSRTRISQRVTIDSHRVDLLMKDRIAHQETILIVKEKRLGLTR